MIGHFQERTSGDCPRRADATTRSETEGTKINFKRNIGFVALAALTVALMAAMGCFDDADVASRNISKAADNFEVDRRVIFINGITDQYLLTIEGRCSIFEDRGTTQSQLEVTCKVGPNAYRKHFLGLSDNVTYLAEQLGPADVSIYHHRITFKPQSIIPDVDFRGGAER